MTFLIFFVFAYIYLGSILILQEDRPVSGTVQQDYLDIVYQSELENEQIDGAQISVNASLTRLFPYYTDGELGPFWPWLMRPYSDLPPPDLLKRGQWINLFVTCSLLVFLGIAAANAFSFPGAIAILSIGGFGILLERSTYFSPDAFYYLTIVLVWLCVLTLIRRNQLWHYALLGALLSVAYLLKPMIWPIIVGFLIVSLGRTLGYWIRYRRQADLNVSEDTWNPTNQLVGFAMLVTAFVLIAGPSFSFANERFGSPFHAYSKYSVWMDSPEEAELFRMNHPSRDELLAIADEDRPSLSNLIDRLGWGGVLGRASEGAANQISGSALSRTGWLLAYGLAIVVIAALFHRWVTKRQSQEIWQLRGTHAFWMLLFAGIVTFLTLGYTGIADPVIRGHPMTTSLFVPIWLTFIWIAERYRRQLQRSRFGILVNRVYLALLSIPIGWVCWRVFQALRIPLA
ncbi:MAG: hypothetical protein AAF236_03115 [Verrucomicrobiota bacterium]